MGHDPTHSIITVDRIVAITVNVAWAQLLTAYTTGPNRDISQRLLMMLISVQANWRLSMP